MACPQALQRGCSSLAPHPACRTLLMQPGGCSRPGSGLPAKLQICPVLPGELRPRQLEQPREAQGAFALPRGGKSQLLKSQLALCQLAYAEEGNYLITYSTPALPEKANIPPPCLAQLIPALNCQPHPPLPAGATACAADFSAPCHGLPRTQHQRAPSRAVPWQIRLSALATIRRRVKTRTAT